MIRVIGLAVIFLLIFGGLSAYALEPFVLYDGFTALTIDDAKWLEAETVRQVKTGKLLLAHRTYGVIGSDTGQIFDNATLDFIDQSAVTAIRATVIVNKVDVAECLGTNPAVTRTRARLKGDFFNTGTATVGSAVNDVLASIAVEHRSSDAQGVLTVKAGLTLCQNSDCTTSITLPGTQTIDLGSVSVGAPVILWMRWDPANNRFQFRRDTGLWVTIPYTVSDAGAPGRLNKSLNISNVVDNCSVPGTVAFMEATFDNVFVNSSAVPLIPVQ